MLEMRVWDGGNLGVRVWGEREKRRALETMAAAAAAAAAVAAAAEMGMGGFGGERGSVILSA